MTTLTTTNQIAQAPPLGMRGGVRGTQRRPQVMGIDGKKLARGLGWFSIGLGIAELIAPRTIARLVGARGNNLLIRSHGLRGLTAGIGILTAARPAGWLWSRAAGEAVDLASLGGMLRSPRSNRGRAAAGIASVAGVAALGVLCAQQFGKSEIRRRRYADRAEASMVVDRSAEDCYNFWRNFENLPRFMSYVESVRDTGGGQSHWIANLAGRRLEWDAKTESDIPNRRISWQSLPGSDISHSGSVEFEPAPPWRGAIVHVRMDYGNLLRRLDSPFAALAARHPEQIIRKELYRFKQVMEIGEVLTTEGQPAGRRSSTTWLDRIAR